MPSLVTKSSGRISRRSAVGWGILSVILAPLLLLLVQRMERDRNARLLEETGATVSVGLNGKRIVGVEFHDTTIDSATAQLLLQHPAIHRLAFTDCRIEAGIPEMLTRLPQLTTLELQRITVAVPGELTQLFKTAPLVAVLLNECPADTLPAEINTERLRTIRIEQFRGEPEGLIRRTARLPGLRSLRYSGTPLPLALCQSISRDHPELEFEVEPGDIVETKRLQDNQIGVALDEQFQVVGLRMDHRSDPISADLIEPLQALKAVSLFHINIDAELMRAICRLEMLEHLHLYVSRLEDAELPPLAGSSQLRELHLNGITTASGEPIRLPSLPHLHTLAVHSQAVVDASFVDAEFPELTDLSISRQVTDDVLRRLLAPGKVETLGLSERELGGAILEAISNAPRLRRLTLWNCQIDDELQRDLRVPGSLENLYLIHTHVSQETIDRLRSSHPQLNVVNR